LANLELALSGYQLVEFLTFVEKITSSSNTESESDTSVCDNASASNPQEPTNKGFPSSTSFLGRLQPVLQIKRKCTLQCALPYKEEKSSCFQNSCYDSHDVNDRVGMSIQSSVRRIIQMEKIKLFQSLQLLLLLMHPISVNNNEIQLHLPQL
ncbi:hypothetical protein Tco_0461003, partial [Tanacetum coccineum]